LRSAFEDRENGQLLIGTETMAGAGRDERGATFRELQLLSVDVECAPPLENDVQLVACVHAPIVWLRRNKRVDTHLEPARLVNNLAPTVSGAKARFGPRDVESVRL
jgi:hypothetical protein